METELNGDIRGTNGRFGPGNKAAVNKGPHKVSTKVKESLVKFLEDNIDAVQESFDQLRPLEKLQFVANILPYVVPKLSAVQSENNTKLSGGLTFRWVNPKSHADLRPTGNEGHDAESLGLSRRLQDNL